MTSKIFVCVYFFILVLGLDYYIARLYGIELINVSSDLLKMSGVVEMLVLTLAVVYRIKLVKIENRKFSDELFQYAKTIDSLSEELRKSKKGQVNLLTEFNLSIREVEVLELISEGMSNKEIAAALYISINTVKTHVRKVYEKLDVKSRKEVLIKMSEA